MSQDLKKRRLRLTITRAFVLFLSIIILYKFWDLYRLKRTLESKLKEKEVIAQKLNDEIEELEEEISESDTLKFVEKVARNDLGMIKPREIMIIDKEKE